MSNSATKAPNFTPENAREMALRSIASKQARKAELARLQAENKERLRLASLESTEEARKKRIEKQIDATLDAMSEDGIDNETRIKLTASLDKLWNLVYAKAGSLRPRPQKQSRSLPIQPIE